MARNTLLTTSYVVDMSIPRIPTGAVQPKEPTGPTKDAKGRPVQFD